jgi:hypothetical protein
VSMVMSLLNEAPQFSDMGAEDPDNWTLLAEALRITYADNNQFIADDDFVAVPIKGLMSDAYIKDRAKLISREGANLNIEAGDPWAYQEEQTARFGKDATLDTHGTTHFVVVDAVRTTVAAGCGSIYREDVYPAPYRLRSGSTVGDDANRDAVDGRARWHMGGREAEVAETERACRRGLTPRVVVCDCTRPLVRPIRRRGRGLSSGLPSKRTISPDRGRQEQQREQANQSYSEHGPSQPPEYRTDPLSPGQPDRPGQSAGSALLKMLRCPYRRPS